MSFTKTQIIFGLAVFLDFEKAFDSIEWSYLLEIPAQELSTFIRNYGSGWKQYIATSEVAT